MNDFLVKIQADEFLSKYQGMSLSGLKDNNYFFEGCFSFEAENKDKIVIKDKFEIQIIIPMNFPQQNPRVRETKGRITRQKANGHIFTNGDLCLGSIYRINDIINNNPTINGFAEKCIIPYLFAISYKEKHGGNLIFGELPHGPEGLIGDILGINDQEAAKNALELVRLKKRIANKKPCPCGCGKRLGVCDMHFKINDIRKAKYKNRKH